LALIKLIALLGVSHGIVAIKVLVGHHAGQRRVNLQFGDVVLISLERIFWRSRCNSRMRRLEASLLS